MTHDHGGDGPPVLFCHATGFHGRYWDPIIERVRDRFRCIALDFRGHGDSVLPAEVGLDWWAMADDVLAVVDAFDLAAVRAVGHSMGGAAIAMAELTRPGTFSVAWMFEPILFPASPPGAPKRANPLAESARRRREVFESREQAYERYLSRPPFSRVEPEALRAYVDYGFADQRDGTVRLKCRGETEASTFESSATGAFERIGEIATAVTVCGSGDGDRPAEVAPLVAARLPRGRLESYPDLTHFAPLEAIDRITHSIVATIA